MKPKVQNPDHQYGTTLPKRTKGIKRSALKQGSKPLPKANPERLKKLAKRARAKHAKYCQSDTWDLVEERCGGMCEFTELVEGHAIRCTVTEGLEHHHVRYHHARYGGQELPEDIQVLCHWHHQHVEALKPAGNRFSRSSRSRAGER